MQTLNLDLSSKALLTKTTLIPDPTKPGQTLREDFLCDVQGNALPQGAAGFPIYRDLFTGTTFVMLCEKIPGGPQSADKANGDYIRSLNPVHYASADGSVNGFFIPAPDFNNRESQPVAAAAAAAAPSGLIPLLK